MTIHTGGGYFFNTVMGILKFVMGFNNELHGNILLFNKCILS